MLRRTRHIVAGLLGLCLPVAFGCQSESPINLWQTATQKAEPPATLFAAAPATLPDDADRLRAELLTLVNAERTKRGLAPLVASAALAEMADYHTSRMIDGDFFSHDDPYDRSTVRVRAAKFDIAFAKLGETLAAGQEAPPQVLADWLNSTSHRATLLDSDFTECGVAVLDGGRFGRYWTVELARPPGR